jgi:hypothetical protein
MAMARLWSIGGQQLVGGVYEKDGREWRKEWRVKNEKKRGRGWPAKGFYGGKVGWQPLL